MDFRVLISPYSKFFNPRGWRAITCLEDVSPWRQNLVSSAPGDILLPSNHATQFCSNILCTFPRKGSTLNRIKIILTVRKLTTLRHQYNQNLKHSIHAKSPPPHHRFFSLPRNTSRKHTNPVFFNLVTLSRITQAKSQPSKISQSLQAISLTIRLSL